MATSAGQANPQVVGIHHASVANGVNNTGDANRRSDAHHPANGAVLAKDSASLLLKSLRTLPARFAAVRAQTERLAAPLSAEDCQVQSMPDASPVKWHLAHTTWFFEVFVLEAFEPHFKPFNAQFKVLFNSYYQAVGKKHPRPARGLLTRPNLQEVLRWRANVQERVLALLAGHCSRECLRLIEIGIEHEQQHQELLLTDAKHMLWSNPVQAAYQVAWPLAAVESVAASWLDFEGGLKQIGSDADGRFAFDNETPRHTVWQPPYALRNRLVTHGEWLDFVDDGGYQNPRWWLAAGWDWLAAHAIEAPLYWARQGDASVVPGAASWHTFTLHGCVPIDPHTPITHISYFEADAFARWRSATHSACQGARLPTETEWEAAVAPQFEALLRAGNFLESRALHPMPLARPGHGLQQALGDVWEWTSSSYLPYPGYQPWAGAAGEYNGKFMVNQTVLRGGSCATAQSHIRASYRNFFPTDARWQFSGLRLARDLA